MAHIEIPVKIKDKYLLDRIIYIPTGKSPTNRQFIASHLDRITMLQNATKEYEFLTVSDYEISSNDVSFSINTINHFKQKYGNSLIRLIMGEDNFVNFPKWHSYRDILSISNIIVLSRDNLCKYDKIGTLNSFIEEDINLFNKTKSEKIHFSYSFKSNLSATILRDSIHQNKSIKDYVSQENYEYIQKNGLYK